MGNHEKECMESWNPTPQLVGWAQSQFAKQSHPLASTRTPSQNNLGQHDALPKLRCVPGLLEEAAAPLEVRCFFLVAVDGVAGAWSGGRLSPVMHERLHRDKQDCSTAADGTSHMQSWFFLFFFRNCSHFNWLVLKNTSKYSVTRAGIHTRHSCGGLQQQHRALVALRRHRLRQSETLRLLRWLAFAIGT